MDLKRGIISTDQTEVKIFVEENEPMLDEFILFLKPFLSLNHHLINNYISSDCKIYLRKKKKKQEHL